MAGSSKKQLQLLGSTAKAACARARALVPALSRSTRPAAHSSRFPSPPAFEALYELGYGAAPPTGTAVLKIVQLHVMGIGKLAGGAAPPPEARTLGRDKN